jgi:amino acid permease
LPTIKELLKGIETSPLGHWVAESTWAFNGLLMVHLIAVTMVFGLILIVDLRLLGVASKNSSVTDLHHDVIPWTWLAFAISVVTGVIIAGQAVKYFDNYGFRMKFALMALAGINMLVFQFITYRSVAKWDRNAPVPLAGKLAGLISLICWIAVIAYGRWTAYFIA